MQNVTRSEVVFVAAFLADLANDTAVETYANDCAAVEDGDVTLAEFAEEGNVRYYDAACCMQNAAALLNKLADGEECTTEEVVEALSDYDTEWGESLQEMFVFYAAERDNVALVRKLNLFNSTEHEDTLLAFAANGE